MCALVETRGRLKHKHVRQAEWEAHESRRYLKQLVLGRLMRAGQGQALAVARIARPQTPEARALQACKKCKKRNAGGYCDSTGKSCDSPLASASRAAHLRGTQDP